jgi:hypothetical protein
MNTATCHITGAATEVLEHNRGTVFTDKWKDAKMLSVLFPRGDSKSICLPSYIYED